MRTKQLLILIFVFVSQVCIAQEWHTDLKQAQKESKITGNNIILVFQGSDWCAPCIKLDRNIWSSNEFKDYSKDNFILVKVDFPRRKKNKLSASQKAKNVILAEKYNPHGYFPYIVALDSKGNVLGTTSYKKISVGEYIKLLSSF